ncbi:CC0125/CC1285 family lipoprotein [Pseudidiomarina sp. E22-M8]|uniref:CC0125/CC1285 family lipoprotein n=1 Tax=Pseudidiomarina sp. E22-M8 TaxID=3424768 RepID=UPI00403CB8F3
MSIVKQFALLCVSFLLVACASSDSYRLTAVPGIDYQQQQLSARRFSLQLAGPSMAQNQQALLLRAAEIARQLDYDWFVLLPQTITHDATKHTTRKLAVDVVLGVGIRPTSTCSYRPDSIFTAVEKRWRDSELLKGNCFT